MFQVTFGLTVLTIIIGVILIKMIRACKDPSDKLQELESRFTKLESDLVGMNVRIIGLENFGQQRSSQNPNYQQPPNYQEPPNYPY